MKEPLTGTHPWYVELECEKCGEKHYIFNRTREAVETTHRYELEKKCSICQGKRCAYIGNIFTDKPKNPDFVDRGKK